MTQESAWCDRVAQETGMKAQTGRLAGKAVGERPNGSGVLTSSELQREDLGGAVYEYYPLGEHVLAAPGVCWGRPRFKYTRIDVAFILGRLAAGETVEDLVAAYGGKLTGAGLEEAQRLALSYPP